MNRTDRYLAGARKAFAGFILLFLMMVFSAFAASFNDADGKQKTVRIGFEDSGLLVTLDKTGKPVGGYAYEYIETFAEIAGWNIEYVHCDSFSDYLQKLLAGDLDLAYDVSYTPERAKLVLFPDSPMGAEEYYLYADSRTKILSGDYAEIEGKRIGVTSGTVQINYLKQWCARKGIDVTLVEFGSVPDKEAALIAGDIDLELEISMLTDRRFFSIEQIASNNYFLVANKSRQDLIEDINRAYTRIIGIDRYYFSRLEGKYFSQTTVSKTMFPDESKWVSTHEVLTVGYLNNYMPFSDTDKNGAPTGAVTEIVPMILGSIGLTGAFKINYVGYDSTEEMYASLREEKTDMVFPAQGDMKFAIEKGISFTHEIVGVSLNLIHRDALTNQTTAVIAVNRKNEIQAYYTSKLYPDAAIRYYDTTEDCLMAVASGKAGSTILNGFSTAALLQSKEADDLNVQILPQPASFNFAVKRGN